MFQKSAGISFKFYILLILSLVYILIYFIRTSLSAIAPVFMDDLNINASQMGIISSTYFLFYALMQPLVGFLTDKFGPRKVILISFITTCLGSLFFGFSDDFLTSFISRSLIGISSAGIFVPGVKLLSDWFLPNQFARANGFFIGIGCVGALLSTVPLSYLELLFGWRDVFIGFSLLGIIFTAFVIVFLKDNNCSNNARQQKASGQVYFQTVKSILFTKKFIIMAIIIFISTGISITFQGLWATKYLITNLNVSAQFANTLILFIPIGNIIGAPLGGYLADKVFSCGYVPLRGSLILQLAVWSFIAFFTTSFHPAMLALMFFILGMCISSVSTIIISAVKEMSTPGTLGITIGIINPAVFAGIFFYQLITGFMLDITSISRDYTPQSYFFMILLFMGSILFTVILSLYLKETHSKDRYVSDTLKDKDSGIVSHAEN